MILVVGYGFADEHINGILTQALREKPDKRLLIATYCGEGDAEKLKADHTALISNQLGLTDLDGKVCVHLAKANKFLGEDLSLAMVSSIFPQVEDIFAAAPATPA